MEPFLLVDEHQVIISISTIWLTVLIALDGTGASRTVFQDPTTPHTPPDELESQVGIPGFLNRLQGSPTLGYYRRSWIPTTHRALSLMLTITSDASVIMQTSFTGREHWRWYLGPTLPVSFPHRRLSWPDLEYAELRRKVRLWPSSWRHPLPWPSRVHYISVMNTPLISANHFIYNTPQPPEWALTGQIDVTTPTGMSPHRLLPFSLPFNMTALDKNFLWGLRRDALTVRNLAPVDQLAYVTVTDTTELEWAWIRVGNDAYSVDSLSPFFYPLRCVSFFQLVSPFLTLPGGRYKILICGPGSATLITVLLPPTLASPDATRGNQRDPPLHRTVSRAGLNRRIFDISLLRLPGFLHWVTEGMHMLMEDTITFSPRDGVVHLLSIHPYGLDGRMEITCWDSQDPRSAHMKEQFFSARAPEPTVMYPPLSPQHQ